ncbi:TetR/AcrR family transcriptional regulator [Microbacterium murale]|uniref:TetR/AcrR family transcriptional repressor of mexJK operon n=1 Tax=Microbacterium murale TaxID=1081040 RepID=A0ABU0PDM1_9MICO|nr:TetR/AcrR family transcriptional regulator [Microbacterium murale]MDQ0645435.1 TetR/AcrR family transcriptional repressor of mexJK operon [Microbacterium murale]
MSAAKAPGRPAGRTGEDLLSVAREVFLERGYNGTSMDEVARRARISKASLYREHTSKTALYSAVVRQWATMGGEAMRPALDRLRNAGDIRQGLIDLAVSMRSGILSPPVLEMRRLVIAEAVAQPEVARMYLAESWARNIQNLAETLEELAQQRRTKLEDSNAAASEFTWLVVGAPLNARLLSGEDDLRGVDRAVDLFLSAYRDLERA